MKTAAASTRAEPAVEQVFHLLRRELSPETVLRRDMPLARQTTLRVGGNADLYVEPGSEEELSRIAEISARFSLPIFMLGRGSNLLIRDGGIRGLVIALAHKNFSQIRAEPPALHCGAGTKLKAVSVEAKRNEIAGLEFLEGIPGSVGGALRMNAGAMGSAMFDVVESIRCMDRRGKIEDRAAREFRVDYRECAFLIDHIALAARLRGRPGKREEIEKKMREFSEKRWKTQPAAPSAGCIFKNSITCPAGRLIEELGLKGMRVGAAEVSTVHGNFIVTGPHAKAQDVLDLIALIRDKARTARGIDLETEVQIVGE